MADTTNKKTPLSKAKAAAQRDIDTTYSTIKEGKKWKDLDKKEKRSVRNVSRMGGTPKSVHKLASDKVKEKYK